MISAPEALEQLRAGNRRFVAGRGEAYQPINQTRPGDLVDGQSPIAVVLGCSDSRVPVEAVFDQGLGKLFVIRVAGHIAGSSQVGSVEYAVQQLGTRLVVVLGHTHCGAVRAAVEAAAAQPGDDGLSPHLRGIVREIQPCVESMRAVGAQGVEALAQRVGRAHVRAVAQRLQTQSPVIQRLMQAHGLVVAGAQYALHSGEVEFLKPIAGPLPQGGLGVSGLPQG